MDPIRNKLTSRDVHWRRLRQERIYWLWLGGLLLIVGGLVYLQNVFRNEANDAQSQLSAQKAALSQYVLKALEQRFHQRIELAKGNVLRLSADPLLSDKGLLYFHQGQQVLPRAIPHAAEATVSAKALYRWTLQVEPLDLISEQAGVWEDRLNLLSNFKLSILNGDQEEARWAFRELREHRALNKVPAAKDIPFMLGVIDYFIQHANPSSNLIKSMLRDGSIVEQENGIFGLQRQLLLNRGAFTADDFRLMAERIVALSERFGVPTEDFMEQARSPSVSLDTADFTAWREGIKGQWYIEPVGGEEFVGVPLNMATLVDQVKREMQLLGLLGASDSIHVPVSNREFHSLAKLPVQIESPYWDGKEADIRQRFLVKTSAVLAFGFLIVVVFVLSILRTLKEQRLIEMKSDFIATVSHELRTPITSLQLMSEGLIKQGCDTPGTRDYPRRIAHVLRELGQLVENILSFNRIRKSLLKAHPAPFSLKAMIGDLAFEFVQYADVRIKIANNVADLTIDADEELVKMLFRNLITNSIKFNDNEVIEIDVSTESSGGVIHYRDNGCGIERQRWQQVFDEFISYRPSNKSVAGTGLGLWLCRRIMELHQGHIDIADSRLGGTDFRIRFPADRLLDHDC